MKGILFTIPDFTSKRRVKANHTQMLPRQMGRSADSLQESRPRADLWEAFFRCINLLGFLQEKVNNAMIGVWSMREPCLSN